MVNKHQIPFPVDINTLFLTGGGVVELLFSDTFSHSDYKYLYSEEDRENWPSQIRQRLMIYASSKVLVSDSTGVNIFNLQNDDHRMLSTLMKYRQDSTSVVIIDSTADISITDTTAGITIITGDFSSLTTSLSKLIFLYLDLHINNHIHGYFDTNVISTDSEFLASCFELKLIDDYFSTISSGDITFSIICES